LEAIISIFSTIFLLCPYVLICAWKLLLVVVALIFACISAQKYTEVKMLLIQNRSFRLMLNNWKLSALKRKPNNCEYLFPVVSLIFDFRKFSISIIISLDKQINTHTQVTIAQLFVYNASGRFWRQRNVLRVEWNLIGWMYMYTWKKKFLEAEPLLLKYKSNLVKLKKINKVELYFLIWIGCWIFFFTLIECGIRKLAYQLKFMDRRAAERIFVFFLEKKTFCMSSFINWKPNLITNCRFA